MSPRILVVDDEEAVVDILAYNLRKAQYDVVVAMDGPEALRQARTSAPDLVILDLMLPGIDGLDVCRELRRTGGMPIIMLTALGEEADKVVGLELGADDYVTKPFRVRELLARIKAVLRRAQAGGPRAPGEVLSGPGQLVLDTARREARVRDTLIDLTQLEFDLLQTLLVHAGRVLTREQLLEQVWNYDYPGDTRAVDSVVKRLRAKLRKADAAADCIESVRGLGYKLAREEA